MADIRRMIENGPLPDGVKQDTLSIFTALAEAEGAIHGAAPEEVRFHEVGATDSIIDILGAVLAFHQLKIDGIAVSPLPVGFGQVVCAHGVYPIPAPATAAILERFALPVASGGEPCEMLTPTGAAILAVTKKFPETPDTKLTLVKTAHSFGHHAMSGRPNLLRASLWESADSEAASPSSGEIIETLFRLECNLDDASGERLAAASAAFFDAGALDVWMIPIGMKKGRWGTLLGVLVRPEEREKLRTEIFRQTGTFGIREEKITRYALARRFETVTTPFGPIRIKIGTRFGETVAFAPEFEDCRAAAERAQTTVHHVFQAALFAYQQLPCADDS